METFKTKKQIVAELKQAAEDMIAAAERAETKGNTKACIELLTASNKATFLGLLFAASKVEDTKGDAVSMLFTSQSLDEIRPLFKELEAEIAPGVNAETANAFHDFFVEQIDQGVIDPLPGGDYRVFVKQASRVLIQGIRDSAEAIESGSI